jgi:hypothetical protein
MATKEKTRKQQSRIDRKEARKVVLDKFAAEFGMGRGWLERVDRTEDDLQRAHYSLIADGLESTSISRSVRAVKLGRS